MLPQVVLSHDLQILYTLKVWYKVLMLLMDLLWGCPILLSGSAYICGLFGYNTIIIFNI